MASSSKSLVHDDASIGIKDLKHLYASNANVSNFVSVKLSGKNNYHLWKKQMLCLMETHNMRSLVDDAIVDGPQATEKRYDSLLKGWIFGSIREDVLGTVVDLGSAKEVWDKLKSIYVPTTSFRQDSAQVKPEEKEETKDNDASTETETKGNDAGSQRDKQKKELCRATMQGCWEDVEAILRIGTDLEREPLNDEKNTVLHLAVGVGHDDFIKNLLQYIVKKESSDKDRKLDSALEMRNSNGSTALEMRNSNGSTALEMRNSNGSTALHVAAIVGHRAAAELLVNQNKDLLTIKDGDNKLPSFKAYANMQFDTFIYLWDQVAQDERDNAISKDDDHITMGVNLLVNAISAKKYSTASELVDKFPKFAVASNDALMAIARTFPNELGYWETFIYPSVSDIGDRVIDNFVPVFIFIALCYPREMFYIPPPLLSMIIFYGPAIIVLWVFFLLRFLIYMVYLPFYLVYFLWWKVAARLGVPPIKHIVEKKEEWEKAKKFLELMCNTIDHHSKFSGTQNPIYKEPILEAARQNAYQVVDEILYRSPETIQSTDENGYDIIQLAVIHRSERIYNLIYQIGEHKSSYGTWKDSSGNNILHLVGRLVPSHELNSRTGAALQLQRELQWREELKKFVFPAYITQENIFKETPAMVFTREHKDLVKEGEKWMKATAESCSITAGLITTIVFAAAITVPGGNHQETGIPLFRNDIAFIIFAASDAISLFASSTALLVFLSILTARFAEQDFLISLPRRLIIGFCALLISTTAMMVSFSAILYLVFCDRKTWMIGLICGLAFIPIACFVALQFSLIVDLHRSTYVRIFGPQTNWRRSRFDPHSVRGYFK